jgi:hypothetical protein
MSWLAGASAGAIVAVGTRCRLGQLDVLGALTAIAEVRHPPNRTISC